ncbi:MAG: hypothetical protein PVI26_10080 [Chitinispirillia bacterium]
MLALSVPPRAGLQILLPASLTIGLYNNKFIIPSPKSLFSVKENPGSWLAHMLIESFDLYGLSPYEVSDKLTNTLKDGIYVHTSMSVHYLDLAKVMRNPYIPTGWGINAATYISGYINLPGDIFATVFSPTSGLQAGNTLTFKDLSAYIEIVTDFRAAFGRQGRKHLSILQWDNIKAAWGVSILYRLGHALLQLETKEGKITYSRNNVLSINGHSKMTTTGTGLHSNYQYTNPFREGIPANGLGLGISGSVSLITDNASLSLYMMDFGPMTWYGDLQQSNIVIQSDSLYFFDFLQNKEFNTFDVGSLKDRKKMIQPLETVLFLDYSYRWKLRKIKDQFFQNFSAYRIISAGFQQPLITRLNIKKVPIVLVAFENGFFNGTLPCKIGWTFGGRERLSSFIEFSQISPGVNFSLWYKAVSNSFFIPSKGTGFGITSRIFWN